MCIISLQLPTLKDHVSHVILVPCLEDQGYSSVVYVQLITEMHEGILEFDRTEMYPILRVCCVQHPGLSLAFTLC